MTRTAHKGVSSSPEKTNTDADLGEQAASIQYPVVYEKCPYCGDLGPTHRLCTCVLFVPVNPKETWEYRTFTVCWGNSNFDSPEAKRVLKIIAKDDWEIIRTTQPQFIKGRARPGKAYCRRTKTWWQK